MTGALHVRLRTDSGVGSYHYRWSRRTNIRSLPRNGGLNRQWSTPITEEQNMINKDQVKGNVKEVGGKIEKEAGKVLGNPKLEAKGAKHELEGKVQTAVGNLKEVIKDAR
jgi:uncharacterized protein YjbJ (UPF0337 family)